ncbi:hypothetical protein [Devosia sp. SD17-2]|jgi:hypothetical protein|uniref:hypothetical protein n=1 Tax=Devosia sp. SD17-2 TaxID=2976459 RepID=UPI0023D8A377|nr:hypothetical protein [Devosia sp. SD17-2]WEJ32752.1 hypothetical protein NYQ88_18005 [Devosia sp. SD17-2]
MDMTRTDTIETVAGILFGRDKAGKPEKGWVAKLARKLDMTPTAVHKTLEKDESPVFDRKLIALIERERTRMTNDVTMLSEILWSPFNIDLPTPPPIMPLAQREAEVDAERAKYGLVDPPLYEDEGHQHQRAKGIRKEHGGSYGFSICFDTRETEKIALSCAQGEGQKWQIQRASWDVENDTSKMRERMEERGLSVEPLGKRYIDGPTIYRISQRGAQNAE